MNLTMSKRSDLAIRAIRALKGSGQATGTDLAEAIDTTIQFLPQILRPLIRAGWVGSDRGPGGGYRLTADLADISLLEILEGVEGPAETGRCVLRDGPCPGTVTCPIHEAWMVARDELVSRLGSLTMDDVLQTEVTK
jgi:Rrf2 family protein